MSKQKKFSYNENNELDSVDKLLYELAKKNSEIPSETKKKIDATLDYLFSKEK